MAGWVKKDPGSNIDVPKRVLDLGAGTGLLTYYWLKECKNTEYVLVDIVEEINICIVHSSPG